MYLQRDILGDCDTEYKFSGVNGTRLIVSKTRDPESCKGRTYIASSTKGVPYVFYGVCHLLSSLKI